MVINEFLRNSSVKIDIFDRTQGMARFLHESFLLELVLHCIRNVNKHSVEYFLMKHTQ